MEPANNSFNTSSSHGLNSLEKIEKSFIDDVKRSSADEAAAKIHTLFRNKHMLCSAENPQSTAFSKRTDGSWSSGSLAKSDKPGNMTVIYSTDAEKKSMGKIIEKKNCLLIPEALLERIQDSLVENTLYRPGSGDQRLSFEQIKKLVLDWITDDYDGTVTYK